VRTKLFGRHFTLLAVIVGAVVLGAAGAVALALANGLGADDVAKHAVDFTKITPLPVVAPIGTPSPTLPDYSNPPKCQLPEDDRPSPDLPPLSCRNSGAEPPPGTIPTVDPAKPQSTPTAAKGFRVIDNQVFRFTVQIPDAWYSDMRPEGGQFDVLDPRITRQQAEGTEETGGVVIDFSATKYVPPYAPGAVVSDTETKLMKPNASFGDVPGVIWEDQQGGADGLAVIIHAAFLKDGVVYEVLANVVDDGQPSDAIQADVDVIKGILATITPY
jgi:hypothetical protein